MAEEILLTQQGYDEKVKELETLTSQKRPEVAERLKEAISYGDISENSEYDSAKNEQAELEEKISVLENTIKNAKIIDAKAGDKNVVSLGRKIKVKDNKSKSEKEYIIVGSAESNPLEGKISNTSPVGAALLGHKVKDKVDVETPDGKVKYEILSIKK
jgi:transcription elongation factor GreA